MKSIRSARLTLISLALIVGAFHDPALGGSPQKEVPAPNLEEEERPPMFEVNAELSYTGEGETEFRGRERGKSDATGAELGVGVMLPLNERWFIPVDLQTRYLSLDDSPAGVPLPDAINTLDFSTGLAYRPNDRWMFMFQAGAGLYKLGDIGGNDIGFSGGLMAMWDYNPSLKFTMGLMASSDGDLPVIPLVGLEWLISEAWELKLTVNDTRLIYSPSEKWDIYAGMDLNLGTTFRAGDTLGAEIGRPEYNDALGSYSDVRVTGGLGYQLSQSLRLETEVGYSVSREIDYSRIDEKVKFDPAPYVSVGLRLEF